MRRVFAAAEVCLIPFQGAVDNFDTDVQETDVTADILYTNKVLG
jgi:hypothetical protein